MIPNSSPWLLIAAVLGGLTVILLLVLAVRSRHPARNGLLLALGLGLTLPAAAFGVLINPWLYEARFAAYHRFYRDIKTGMTSPEVLTLMERHYPVAGPRARPTIMENTPQRLGFFMNPEHVSEPNCEGIFLGLQNGVVVSKGYSAD
jgi:hypothetical protein